MHASVNWIVAAQSWIASVALLGCYSTNDTTEPLSQKGAAVEVGAPQTGGASGTSGSGAVGEPGTGASGPRAPQDTRSGSSTGTGGVGAAGCSYSLPGRGTLTYEDLGFKGIGGAGDIVVDTCARCGVPYQGMLCHAAVSLLPTIDDPRYGLCGMSAFAYADCLEPASCVCGSLPKGCESGRQQLEMCMARAPAVKP